MKAVPGTLQDGGAPFVTTHWSIIAACSDLSSAAAHAGLAQPCWAAQLLTRALERLAAECLQGQKAHLFAGLTPFLTGGIGPPSQEATVARLEMPVETLRSHLSRLRARYREVLREEVAR